MVPNSDIYCLLVAFCLASKPTIYWLNGLLTTGLSNADLFPKNIFHNFVFLADVRYRVGEQER